MAWRGERLPGRVHSGMQDVQHLILKIDVPAVDRSIQPTHQSCFDRIEIGQVRLAAREEHLQDFSGEPVEAFFRAVVTPCWIRSCARAEESEDGKRGSGLPSDVGAERNARDAPQEKVDHSVEVGARFEIGCLFRHASGSGAQPLKCV